jgi:heme/copper-type cytochrome/quinol oxidase subunit 3
MGFEKQMQQKMNQRFTSTTSTAFIIVPFHCLHIIISLAGHIKMATALAKG